jgi:YD repeat-containing protein
LAGFAVSPEVYEYDVLDNLTRVDQKGNTPDTTKWRTRMFTYDSLSQLRTALNPESGTIQYSYDSDGNLATRIDARTITTTFSYDALHRLTSKTYTGGSPATPTATYCYDSCDGLSVANSIEG